MIVGAQGPPHINVAINAEVRILPTEWNEAFRVTFGIDNVLMVFAEFNTPNLGQRINRKWSHLSDAYCNC